MTALWCPWMSFRQHTASIHSSPPPKAQADPPPRGSKARTPSGGVRPKEPGRKRNPGEEERQEPHLLSQQVPQGQTCQSEQWRRGTRQGREGGIAVAKWPSRPLLPVALPHSLSSRPVGPGLVLELNSPCFPVPLPPASSTGEPVSLGAFPAPRSLTWALLLAHGAEMNGPR